MEKISVKEYADRSKITVPAAHKRFRDISKYPEIKKVEKITKKFFLIYLNKN